MHYAAELGSPHANLLRQHCRLFSYAACADYTYWTLLASVLLSSDAAVPSMHTNITCAKACFDNLKALC